MKWIPTQHSWNRKDLCAAISFLSLQQDTTTYSEHNTGDMLVSISQGVKNEQTRLLLQK